MAIGDFMSPGYNFGNTTGGYNLFGSSSGNVGFPSGLDPNVRRTFTGRPQEYFQAARIAQMGQQAALPQFYNQANLGFTPAFGSYLMAAPTSPTGELQAFSEWAPSASSTDRAQQWANVLAASSSFDTPGVGLTPQQRAIRGTLSGEDARRNSLAIAASRMGGGVGYMANARQRALGNLYDLYSARSVGAGKSPGTFLSYLNNQQVPSVAPIASGIHQ